MRSWFALALVPSVIACGTPGDHGDAMADGPMRMDAPSDALDGPIDAVQDAVDVLTDGPRDVPMCESPVVCPGVDTSCSMRTCIVGRCGVSNVAAGTVLDVMLQSVGDCQTLVCDGAGHAESRVDDTDIPNDHSDCTIDSCVGGVQQFMARGVHAPCSTGVCDSAATCVGCVDATDCTAAQLCFHNACLDRGCGNGVVESGEQCDDGNTTAGDGCSATCTFEANFVTEVEPNDTRALANPLGAADGFIAAIVPLGDVDFFSFAVTIPGSTVFVEVSDGLHGCPGFDSLLTISDSGGTVIATDDNGGVAPCSRIVRTNLTVGTYAVRVEQNGGTAIQSNYVVTIRVAPPACGDAVVQAGEQCDDGNTLSGDGCSSTCMTEPPYEIEPNDSAATATPPWPSFAEWRGAINPATDVDYFSFVVPGPSSRVLLTTHDPGSTATCAFDTIISLIAPDGTRSLASDDDGGVGLCSRIDGATNAGATALPAGTYFVRVSSSLAAHAAIPAYAVDVAVF